MKGRLWLTQSLSGILLVLLLAAHLLANHADGGLLTYDRVLERFHNPLWFAIETAFLFTVIYHALRGLYGVVADYLRDDHGRRLAGKLLAAAGILAASYGIWLSLLLRSR